MFLVALEGLCHPKMGKKRRGGFWVSPNTMAIVLRSCVNEEREWEGSEDAVAAGGFRGWTLFNCFVP